MTRFNKASICHNGPGIKADKITHFNTKGTGFFLIGHFFIQTDFHIVLGPLDSPRLLVDVARSLMDQNRTRMGLSGISHMDRTIFPFNHIPRETTDTVQLEAAICFHSADNSPQGIHMGCDVALLVCDHTRNGHIHATLSSPSYFVPKAFNGFDQIVCDLTCKTGR